MSVQLMAGILQGFQKSEDRLRNIRASSDEKRRRDEAFEMDKKIKTLQIDKLEMMGELDRAAAELERKRMKEISTIYDSKSELDEMAIDEALTQTQDMQEHLKAQGQRVAGTLMRQQQYVPFKGFRNVPVPKASGSTAVPAADKVLGALDSGGVYNQQMGAVTPFGTRENAEAYAAQNLGPSWKTKYPDAKKKIELNYGGIDILPRETKKTSEALKYLKDTYGLDDTQAAQWLRKNSSK